MKTYYISLCLLITSLTFGQDRLSQLDKSDMETSILFTSFPVIDIADYQKNKNSSYSFLQAYKAISLNDLEQRYNSLEDIENGINLNTATIPIGILHTEYEVIKPEAIENGEVYADSNKNLRRLHSDTSIFNKNELSIIAPLKAKHKGLQTTFNISSDHIFNSTDKEISSIKINFDDGQGFTHVPLNTNMTINYSSQGAKTLNSILTFNDGSTRMSSSTITISYSKEDINQLPNRAVMTLPPNESTNSIAPNLTPYGVANDIGQAEYEIFLSPDGDLDKPIILIDGFDPGDTRDIVGLYDLLNFDDNGTPSNLGDLVRAEGYDVVILNFPTYVRDSDGATVDGGADFIERNAMLLVELIEIINTEKVGMEQNVIIGPSMGGLISRYALNFMENQNITHDTRLWISFDSPHHGANVPIGMQYLFNNLAYNLDLGGLGGDQSVIALRPIIDGMLNSPAARQMLTDHFQPHLASPGITTPLADNYNTIFFNGLNGLTTSGFPETIRNVSMINGSGTNNRYSDKNGADILPNREIINTTLEVIPALADATFRIRFTPEASMQNQASFVFIDAIFICFCDLTLSEVSTAFSYTDGIDAASGGLFDIGALAGSLGDDDLINGFFGALQTDFFNFIPSVSSMALEITNNEVDWFHLPENLTSNSLAVNNVTPFANWYMPDDNEPHVTLTQENVAFALSEIRQETLNVDSLDNTLFKIEKNPISDELVLLSSQTINNAHIKITDITGKVIFENIETLNSRTIIPINLSSGLYVLNIDANSQIYQTKIIVR